MLEIQVYFERILYMIFKLLDYFKRNDIEFCIINGYECIVSQIDKEADNDILLRKKDFSRVDGIVETFSKQNGFLVVQNMHHDIFAKNIFVFDQVGGEFLNLDIYGELSRKGVVCFDEDDIFSTLQTYEQLPILGVEKEFTYYLIKKLDKKSLTKESFIYLRNLYLKKQELCKKHLKKFFPTTFLDLEKGFEDDNFELIDKNQKKIINDFYKLKNFSLTREFLNIARVCKRVLKPTGLSIGFLGPDGSGKSTVIDGILEKRLPFRRKDYFHLKPIKSTNRGESVTVDEPHLMPLYSKSKSYIKLFYFIYQYNLGWIKNIIKLNISSSLVIFDRYFDDMLVDNKRYRYGGSVALAKIARVFIPKPNIYFILTTDANVIYERKQEVAFDELKRQIEAYKALADNKRYFSIDVGRTPEEIVKEINNIMMEKMNER